jgi:hypothetical protein
MGLFSSFKGNKAAPRTDLVWQTYEAKVKGCVDFLKNNKVDICVAWFQATNDQFNQFFSNQYRVNYKVVMANTLFPFSLDNKNVLFLEHYPMFSIEENLLGKSKPVKITFINSLEDPILKIVGGNISKMMDSLGMKKDECLEHPLISKSIIGAQKKIQKEIGFDFRAKSGDDWVTQFLASKKKTF